MTLADITTPVWAGRLRFLPTSCQARSTIISESARLFIVNGLVHLELGLCIAAVQAVHMCMSRLHAYSQTRALTLRKATSFVLHSVVHRDVPYVDWVYHVQL